jgi:glycosyltransferase involved in cell wall biosynthesis
VSAAAPDISVVIPTWNRRETLGPVLAALARQTFPRERFEVLLCDAGSTDGSADLPEAVGLGNVRWLPGPNRGRAAARNRGIAAARAELVVFTDADIVPEDDWLDVHAAAHAREPGARCIPIAGGGCRGCSSSRATHRCRARSSATWEGSTKDFEATDTRISSWGIAWRDAACRFATRRPP